MHYQLFLSTPTISIFTFFFISLFILPISHSQDDENFELCFSPFKCGDIENLKFPFWTEDRPQFCHQEGFNLTKCEDPQPVINIGGNEFRLIYLNNSTYTMTIARNDLWEQICPSNPITVELDNPFLRYSQTNQKSTFFYNCNSSLPPPAIKFECTQGLYSFYAADYLVERDHYEDFNLFCRSAIQVQVNQSSFTELQNEGPQSLEDWKRGFDVVYNPKEIFCQKCNSLNGKCANLTASQYPICKIPGSSFGQKRALAIGFAGAAISLLITCVITLWFRRKMPCIRTMGFLWKFTKIDQDIEAFIRNNGTLAPKRYSYSDVRKMTNSFKEKLGKGGFGSVYKGKLLDGHLVAVKVLNTSKGNGQEFINEVASISQTSHVNVVTLLGFCLEGGKRALIYEFMPNGSLERFIYKENTLKDLQRLTSEELYRIAIGIARGLEYLHRGCKTRILHFDIKPHNILLDENFCPKISDFGLAKLCTRKDSFVSMLEARGTIGYIAPEVFCRNVGSVSHKSDVYSYGMMILEMVGGRRNVEVGVCQTSEIYFPHWIYRHLEQGSIEPELLGLMTREETEIARKMILIGLWCIQTNPTDRPSISKVIEMLEGNIEVLQTPPKPYLSSSPPRSPLDKDSTPLSLP
ncbi:hypothetical protein CRYUN_Cryun12cG0114300 [Craigia yunnanensis]